MNFKKFDVSDNQWHDIPYYQHSTATDTLTLPAVIYPNDTSITVGLKGNTVQNGTPTPDNPIMPQGTGERTGNLWDGNYENGVLNTDGTLNAPNVNYNTTMYIPTEEKNYTLSVICNYDSGLRLLRVCFYDENKNFISYVDSPGFRGKDFFYEFNFTAPVNSKYLRISYIFRAGMSDTNIMLNTGSTALPYEPYGYKIPISSASTTTPVYLGEVETTRRIKKLVFDGTENLNEGASNYYISINISGRGEGIPNSTALSTHTESGVVVNNNGTALFFKKSVFVHSSLADFKTYLQQQYAAGTPVTVWYVLAEPTTGIVNEPLRKIGEYADEVSGISIPVTAGANTLSVGTTLQPSEVTATYKGWHPVADVHEKSVNLAPPNSEWVSGYIDAAGALRPAEGARYEKSSDFIEIQPDTDYAFSCNGGFPYIDTDDPWRGICTYDANKNYILRRAGNTTNSISITTESNAKYVRLSCRTYGKDIEPMLNTGSTALPYEPYWT